MITWHDIISFALIILMIAQLIINVIFSRLENKKIREISELLDKRDRLLKKENEKKRIRIPFKDFWKMN